jgi:hypothetical protein
MSRILLPPQLKNSPALLAQAYGFDRIGLSTMGQFPMSFMQYGSN